MHACCVHIPTPKTGIPKPIVDLRLLEKFVNLFSFGFLRPTHSVPQAGLELGLSGRPQTFRHPFLSQPAEGWGPYIQL